MEDIIRYGRKMVEQGLTYASMGNISRRAGKDITISRKGAMLDELGGALILVALDGPVNPDASSDYPIHRAIYLETDARAVLHGHSPYAVAVSLTGRARTIKPLEYESRMLLPEIPVIKSNENKEELGAKVAKAMSESLGCIVRGHGPYARGKTAADAFTVLAIIEHACRVKYLVDLKKC
ncbi:MAG: fuculose phosphate aldolase [Planctomycetota bacterium]|nr:MAG: fuculose phosphate aldolase [Planctomycetota bacterium]